MLTILSDALSFATFCVVAFIIGIICLLIGKLFYYCKDLYFSKKELLLLRLLEDRQSVKSVFNYCNKLPKNYLINLENQLIKYLAYFLENCDKKSMNFWIVNIEKMEETSRDFLIATTQKAILAVSLDKLVSYYSEYLLDRVSYTNPADFYKNSDSYISDQFIFDVISNNSDSQIKFNFAVKLREKANNYMQKSELARGIEVLIEAELVRIENFFNYLDRQQLKKILINQKDNQAM